MEPDPKLLTTLFDEQLDARNGAPDRYLFPNEAVALVHDILDAVAGSASGGAPDPAADAAVQALETVRAALSVLDAVIVHRPRPRWEQREQAGRFALFRSAPPPPAPPPPPQLLVDPTQLLHTVRTALEGADRLRAAAVPPPPVQVQRPWAEDPELVGLLHDLMVAARRRTLDFLLARIEQLADDLERDHGIAVVDHAPATAQHFELVESPNPDDREPRTVRPALVRDGTTLRAGEVRVPARTDPTPKGRS